MVYIPGQDLRDLPPGLARPAGGPFDLTGPITRAGANETPPFATVLSLAPDDALPPPAPPSSSLPSDGFGSSTLIVAGVVFAGVLAWRLR